MSQPSYDLVSVAESLNEICNRLEKAKVPPAALKALKEIVSHVEPMIAPVILIAAPPEYPPVQDAMTRLRPNVKRELRKRGYKPVKLPPI